MHPSYSKNLFSHVCVVLHLSMVLSKRVYNWLHSVNVNRDPGNSLIQCIIIFCITNTHIFSYSSKHNFTHIDTFFDLHLFKHPTVDCVICSVNQNPIPVTGIHQPVLQPCFASTGDYTRYSTRYITKNPVKKPWVMVSARCALWNVSSTSNQYHGKDNSWDQWKNVRSLFRKVLYCHALPPQRYMKPQKPSFSIRIVTNFVHY